METRDTSMSRKKTDNVVDYKKMKPAGPSDDRKLRASDLFFLQKKGGTRISSGGSPTRSLDLQTAVGKGKSREKKREKMLLLNFCGKKGRDPLERWAETGRDGQGNARGLLRVASKKKDGS